MSFFSKIFGNSSPAPAEDENAVQAQQNRDFNTLRDDGVRAMSMGEFPFAVKCFKAALGMKDDLHTLSLYAETLYRMGDFPEAHNVLTQLSQRDAENVNVLLLLARVEGEMQMYTEMRDTLFRIKEADQAHSSVRYLMADAEFHTGNHLTAIVHLTQLLADETDYLPARVLRARVLLDMGSATQAIEDTQFLMDAVPENEEIYHLHAQALMQTADTDGAETILRRLLELNPFHSEGAILLGALFMQNGRLDEALGFWNEIIALQPDFAEAYRQRGAVKYQLHNERGAAEDLKRSLELQPESAAEIQGEFSNLENEMNNRFRNMNPYGF